MSKTLYFGLLFLSIFFTNAVHATGDSLKYLTLKDTIFLKVGPFNEKIFEHQVEAKQTLFSLAHFYGLSIEELYMYNPGLEIGALRIGQRLSIPIPNRAIIRYKTEIYDSTRFVPVFYIVRQGDTMFGISKYGFRMPMDTIMQRNNMNAPVLQTGQHLHVGWMSIDGIPEEYRQYHGNPLERRNSAMKNVYMRANQGKKAIQHQGAAFWIKDSKEDSDFYALHRHAPQYSIIEVTNPMNNRVVYVKVIGKIPDTAYRDNVVVVLSPLAAKALGAVDPQFFVRVTYFTEEINK